MKRHGRLTEWGIVLLLLAFLMVSACAPAAVATPTPGKPPLAAPTATSGPPAPTATSKPAAPATPTAPAPAAKVRFGSPGFLADAPVFVALERGYFKEQGIELV